MQHRSQRTFTAENISLVPDLKTELFEPTFVMHGFVNLLLHFYISLVPDLKTKLFEPTFVMHRFVNLLLQGVFFTGTPLKS